MANNYYTHTTYPAANSQGASAGMRGELAAIMAGFDLLPDPLGVGLKGFSDGRWEGATIVGGTMDGVVIGATSAVDGTFADLIVGGVAALGAGTVTGVLAGSGAAGLTGFAISGGTLDNTPIGGTTANSIKATTLNASGVATLASTLNLTGAFNLASGTFEHGNPATVQSPFIDFHSSGLSSDYDARIIASGGTATAGQGGLSLFAAAIVLSVRPTFAGQVPWDHGNLPNPASLSGGSFTGNITLFQAAVTSPALLFNANGYAPWMRGNNTAPGYIEWINSASTRVNMSIRDDGYLTVANGASFGLRPTWQGGATPWDNTNLNAVSQLANNVGYLTGGGTIQNAVNAGNANTVGGIAFQYTAIGGQPTYAWGTNGAAGSNFLTNPAGWSVNYANSAGSVGGTTDPASRSFTGSSTGIGAEIGPLTKNSGGNPLDAPSPWVMGGIRVAANGWLGPSADCAGVIYVRLTQVQQR